MGLVLARILLLAGFIADFYFYFQTRTLYFIYILVYVKHNITWQGRQKKKKKNLERQKNITEQKNRIILEWKEKYQHT